MTQKQIWMYRGEWKKTRDALRKYGRTPAEADAKRMEIHAEALAVKNGMPKSSLALTNPELTRILGLFWVWSFPDDLMRQMRQGAQKWEHYAAKLLEACGVEPHGRTAYLEGICRRIFKKPLSELKMEEWPDIIGALNHTRMHKQGVPHRHGGASHPASLNPPNENREAELDEIFDRHNFVPIGSDDPF